MSPTTALNARVAQLKAEGKDVVKLNIGEPDASTFDYIKVAGIKAIADGFTKYTVGSGIPELRKAISEKLQKENNLTYPINQITVTVGRQTGGLCLHYVVGGGGGRSPAAHPMLGELYGYD